MTELKVGDRVECHFGKGTVISVREDGLIMVDPDASPWRVNPNGCKLLEKPPMGLLEEVQPMVDELVARGQDKPRLLTRQVAQLLVGTKGRLTRGERLQSAAMLLVAAGLAECVSEEDEG